MSLWNSLCAEKSIAKSKECMKNYKKEKKNGLCACECNIIINKKRNWENKENIYNIFKVLKMGIQDQVARWFNNKNNNVY